MYTDSSVSPISFFEIIILRPFAIKIAHNFNCSLDCETEKLYYNYEITKEAFCLNKHLFTEFRFIEMKRKKKLVVRVMTNS